MALIRVGIDIGARAVKAAWREGSGSGPGAWTLVAQPRAPNDTPEHVAEALHGLLAPLRRRRSRVELVLAVTRGHVRTVRLEAEEARAMASAIRQRVPKLFPFDPEHAIIRHRLLHVEADGVRAVHVAACDAAELEAHLRIISSAGWLADRAWPSACALAAMARTQRAAQDEPALVLELGAQHSLIVIVNGSEIVLAREVALGSDALTEALTSQVAVGEQTVQLSWEEAEALKARLGIPAASHTGPEGRIPVATYVALLQPILEQWAGEIQRTIAYSAQSHPDVTATRVLLSGGASQLPGLEAWLAAQVQLPVQRLSSATATGQDRPEFTVACGLALAAPEGCVSLLPQRHERMRRLVQGATVGAYVLAALSAALWLMAAMFVSQRHDVEHQLRETVVRQQALAPSRALAQMVEARERLMQELTSAQAAPGVWLRKLADGFPPAVRLTSLRDNAAGRVTLEGEAQSRGQTPEAAVSEFAMWLEQSGLCSGVELESSQRSASAVDLVEFTVACQRR